MWLFPSASSKARTKGRTRRLDAGADLPCTCGRELKERGHLLSRRQIRAVLRRASGSVVDGVPSNSTESVSIIHHRRSCLFALRVAKQKGVTRTLPRPSVLVSRSR